MIDLRTPSELPKDGTYVVSVIGELDLHTARQLDQELMGAFENDTRRVIVDLSGCEFIDSTALAILVKAKERLGTTSQLRLVSADRNVRKIFEITGLDRVFAVHPTQAAAMNGASHSLDRLSDTG